MSAGQLATAAGLAALLAVLAIGSAARRRPPTRGPAGPRLVPCPTGRSTRVVAALAGGTLVVGVLRTIGPIGLGALLVTLMTVRARARRRQQRRQRALVEARFPDAVELLVVCLHAGRSPLQAVDELARRAPVAVRPGFAAVVARLDRGAALADALAALPVVLGSCARDLATSIAAADREGLALAPVLDRLADDARSTRRRLGDAAARQLPVRLSFPLVVCTLPAFVLLALAPAVLGAVSTLRGSAP